MSQLGKVKAFLLVPSTSDPDGGLVIWKLFSTGRVTITNFIREDIQDLGIPIKDLAHGPGDQE